MRRAVKGCYILTPRMLVWTRRLLKICAPSAPLSCDSALLLWTTLLNLLGLPHNQRLIDLTKNYFVKPDLAVVIQEMFIKSRCHLHLTGKKNLLPPDRQLITKNFLNPEEWGKFKCPMKTPGAGSGPIRSMPWCLVCRWCSPSPEPSSALLLITDPHNKVRCFSLNYSRALSQRFRLQPPVRANWKKKKKQLGLARAPFSQGNIP